MSDCAGSGPPRVSVIIPTRNRATLLPRAVRSVLAQTCADFELIIVDDHSTDETPAVIGAFRDRRIRSLRHERNIGQSGAFNSGTACARGEYVAFLDDDDEWLPDKLAAQVAVLDAAPRRVGLVYGWRDVMSETSNRPIRTVRETMRGDLFEHMLALKLPVPPSSWLLRKSVAESVGGFDEDLRVAKDIDFIARVCERGWLVEFVPRVVLLQYKHAHGQLTDPTRENLVGRADQIRTHLARFARELSERPAARAKVHLRLAHYELKAGNRREGLESVASALRLDPAGVSRKFLRHWRYAVSMAVAAMRATS